MLAALLFLSFLPTNATAALNARYPGWQPSAIAPQIESWFQEYRFKYMPNRVEADFDGDGAADYVVLINRNARELLVALLARKDKWEIVELADDPPDPFTYLLLNAQGERDFDFRTLKHFRHPRNSVVLTYFDRRPLVFAWRRGSFQRNVQLSDEEE